MSIPRRDFIGFAALGFSGIAMHHKNWHNKGPKDEPDPEPTPPEEPTGRCLVGAYNGNSWTNDQAFMDRCGVNLDFATTYAGGTTTKYPTPFDQERAANGVATQYGYATNNRDGTFKSWRDIAAGRYDDVFYAIAGGVSQHYGHKSFSLDIEPDVKMNQGKVPSDWTEAEFIAAWRHLAGIFRDVDSTINMRWWVGGSNRSRCATLYPGDDYVDEIGWDPYVTSPNPATNTAYGEFSVFSNWLDQQSWGQGKARGICETGFSTDHPDEEAIRWWSEVPDAVAALDLRWITFFNRNSTWPYNIDDKPDVLAAYGDAMRRIQAS